MKPDDSPSLERPPLVSVVIPAFDAEAFVGAAVESALAQTHPRVEVIVVDDGSTDATLEALEPYRGRITVVEQPNAGPARARNRGIEEANGALVAFLDADDLWLPTKLEKQVARFAAEPELGLVTTGAESFGRAHAVDLEKKRERLFGLDDVARAVLLRSGVATPTVMVPRRVLEETGGFDEELRIGEDDHLWIRIAARYRIAMVDEVLVRVRKTGGSLTSDAELLYREVMRSMDKLERDPELGARLGHAIEIKRARVEAMHGYHRFEEEDLPAARGAFLRALGRKPWYPRAVLYLMISSLPLPIVRRLRAAWRRLRPGPSGSA